MHGFFLSANPAAYQVAILVIGQARLYFSFPIHDVQFGVSIHFGREQYQIPIR
jgi:hypothetical protein